MSLTIDDMNAAVKAAVEIALRTSIDNRLVEKEKEIEELRIINKELRVETINIYHERNEAKAKLAVYEAAERKTTPEDFDDNKIFKDDKMYTRHNNPDNEKTLLEVIKPEMADVNFQATGALPRFGEPLNVLITEDNHEDFVKKEGCF